MCCIQDFSSCSKKITILLYAHTNKTLAYTYLFWYGLRLDIGCVFTELPGDDKTVTLLAALFGAAKKDDTKSGFSTYQN
jgi:hypothetical protein